MFTLNEIAQMVKDAENQPKAVAIGGFATEDACFEVRIYDNGMLMIENIDMFSRPKLSAEAREEFKKVIDSLRNHAKIATVL